MAGHFPRAQVQVEERAKARPKWYHHSMTFGVFTPCLYLSVMCISCAGGVLSLLLSSSAWHAVLIVWEVKHHVGHGMEGIFICLPEWFVQWPEGQAYENSLALLLPIMVCKSACTKGGSPRSACAR